MPKNIVLCADGTGNSTILGRGTNVFKLYEAVDLEWRDSATSKPVEERIDAQVAFYSDGVGTESIKSLRLLTGAFGIGVRRNVRQLYKQLARVYEPGDQIYLFGFSRGAYTVRMLAGLVAECGIIKSNKLTDGELERGADVAFDALRSQFRRLFLRKRNQGKAADPHYVPGAVRRFRASYPSWLPDGCHPHEQHPGSSHFAASEDGKECDGADGVRIRFIGCWDTVVAYGFPMHEVAEFWDRFIYPFRFPDTYLSDVVDHACQALSIDDERQTLSPVLWQARRKPADDGERGDIDRRIEQVWFAGSHSNVGGGYPKQGMSLVALNWMLQKAEAHGLHFIRIDREYVEKHEDVHDKLYDSRSGLAAYYRYLPRDIGALCTDANIDRPTLHFSVLQRIRNRTDEYAPAHIPSHYEVEDSGCTMPPAVEFESERRVRQLEVVQDVIWWRRVVYYLLVLISLVQASFAWCLRTEERFPDISDWSGPSRGFYFALNPVLDLVDRITPASVGPGLNALRHYPLVTSVFALLFLGVWYLGRGLQQYSRELSFRAWRGSLPSPHGETYPQPIRHTALLRVAHFVRRLPLAGLIVKTSRYVLPPVFLSLFAAILLGTLCGWIVPALSVGFSSVVPPRSSIGEREWAFTFDTTEPLQPTPVMLERGHLYRIRVLLHTPWTDRTLEATPTGVHEPSMAQNWLGGLRRDCRYPWFMLLGSVGIDPKTTFPVGLEKVVRPDTTGRLYLFVNDVYGFYHNNEGTAEMRVERLTAEE